MICSVHQPAFLPYLGFFRKALRADVFLLYDTAQYAKRDWHNRNRIKTKRGAAWLTVPVSVHLGEDFNAAKPANDTFIQSHLGIIHDAYKKAPYFAELYPGLQSVYALPFATLNEFNCNLLMHVFQLLRIDTQIKFTHEFDIGGAKSTEALVALCKALGATAYISGVDGRKYLDMELFREAGIEVQFNDFVSRPYPQQWGGEFVPNLSVVDALFNVGAAATRRLIEE